MAKVIFEQNKFYYSYSPSWKIANLSNVALDLIFTDGRHISPIMEAWMKENFTLNHIDNSKGDFADDSGRIYEMRSFSKKSEKKKLLLIPSNMIGAGRKYNEEKYVEKLTSIEGFIVSIHFYGKEHIMCFNIPSKTILDDNVRQDINKDYVSKCIGIDIDYWFRYLTMRCKEESRVYAFDIPTILGYLQ